MVMIYKRIDMKFNGAISNSIFCVIHKSFGSILHCFLVISVLVNQMMWREVLCDGNCFISEPSRLYVFTALVLHHFSFMVCKDSHFAATQPLPHFRKVKDNKSEFCRLYLVA